ncbi:LysR family transcriptional regulator [Vibrio ezurae]|uniref:Putative LysR family transcriptional regulator n=1 Tax=Vibrio ezurae NBRC 102218 TaxID=1219080 RepID=U3CL37_9VIBR|nr:LysR family transcriptional regulator [Vibrio ezurae]GAD78898.1 putative LysR family transcriptional regulator [Vibrio ezurae NBRC 102218]
MIEAIEAFILAAEHNSFSIAAKKQGKSQSAVSQLIHNLEIDLGYELFDRRGRFISLNDNGQALLKQARMVKAQYSRFVLHAEQLKTNQKQRINIGIDPLLCPKNTTRLIQQFEVTFSSVEVHLVYRDSQSLNELLLAKELDIVIGGNDAFLPASEYHTESIGTVENVWIAKEDAIQRINSAEQLFELSTYRYLIPPQFETESLKAITEIASVWRIDDIHTLFKMCESGSNIACIPHNALAALPMHEELRVVSSRLLPKVKKGLVLSWHLDTRTAPFCKWISQSLQQKTHNHKVSRVLETA